MGEVGMAWRCLYRLAGRSIRVHADRKTTRVGGKSEENVEGYGIGKIEKEKETTVRGGG